MRKREVSVLLVCLLLAAATLAVCSKSSFLYPINDWTDANAYLSVGKGMLRGEVVYRDLYEHKGPLLYALHALCCLVTSDTFLGVYLLETLEVGLFLFMAWRLFALYEAPRAGLLLLPVIALATLSSVSFQAGDSAEEMCLPLMAASLYALLRSLRRNEPMGARTLLCHGALCGCVLWIKFNMLGFYAAWFGWVFVSFAARGQWGAAWKCAGWFALGVLAATVPWAVYFGVNGAVGPWLKTYLYDNLFLYSSADSLGLLARAKGVVKALWEWLTVNPAYAAPTMLGALWLTCSRAFSRYEKAALWLLAALTAGVVFVGGRSYPYYGFALAVLIAPALLPLGRLLEPLLARNRAVFAGCAAALCLAAAPLGALCTPNRADLGKKREDTMQYRFAAYTDQTPGATLLNYDFMDAGFYTACRIVPSVKYFHRTNVPLAEMRSEQARYIAEGLVDYVAARNPLPPELAAGYTLLDIEDTPEGFWYEHVYLYRRNAPAV